MRPNVLLVASAFLPLLGCGPARPTRNLLLITVDTLRADVIGRVVAGAPIAPHLSAFAQSALRFRDISSVASETSPGVAAILTGVGPHRSGVFGNRHQLPDNLETIASALARRGYRTTAFVANPVLAARYGFGNGFQSFESIAARAGEKKARGEDLLDRAALWLSEREHEKEPTFLWLHLLEPHGPYEPPAEVTGRLPLEAFGPAATTSLCEPGNNGGWQCIPSYQQKGAAPETDARRYARDYFGEVIEVDRLIGEFLARPECRAFLEQAVVAITADHGEALAGDHGFYFSHGHPLSEDQIAVPLMIRAPGLAAREIAAPASLVDLFPTLAALLGLSVPAVIDGHDLLTGPSRAVVGLGRNDEFIRLDRLKLRHSLDAGSAPSLYDLALDPVESVDLGASRPTEVERLLRALRAVRALPPLARATKRPVAGSADERELRSLGYL